MFEKWLHGSNDWIMSNGSLAPLRSLRIPRQFEHAITVHMQMDFILRMFIVKVVIMEAFICYLLSQPRQRTCYLRVGFLTAVLLKRSEATRCIRFGIVQ